MPTQPKGYQCVAPCRSQYSKSSSLIQHQTTCHNYLRIRHHSQRAWSSQDSRESVLSRLLNYDNTAKVTSSGSSAHLPHKIGPEFDNNSEVTTPAHLFEVPEATTSVLERPQRDLRLPRRFLDITPEPLRSTHDTESIPTPTNSSIRRVNLVLRDHVKTAVNRFGLWRSYSSRPSTDPDGQLALEDMLSSHISTSTTPPLSSVSTSPEAAPDTPKASHWPFPSKTVHLLMTWLNNGHSSKSELEVNTLVNDCILSPDFRLEDLKGFDARRQNHQLDQALASSNTHNRFIETVIEITVPSGKSNIVPPTFAVPGLLHRSITSVIRDAFVDTNAHLLHYSPYKLYHETSPDASERVYGEIYSSDAFLEEHERVQGPGNLPVNDTRCMRERVVAALMFSSDATHLANFGTAKAWPIYMMLGNLSKYVRSHPNSGAIHHLAYIPMLPDSFDEFVASFHPSWRSQQHDIKAHCRRELVHTVWKTILKDEDFQSAYRYGIVIQCIDGVERRVYPRIFTYSADYPEKVLLASIRDKGLRPCPRCLIRKTEIQDIGSENDQAIRSSHIRTYRRGPVALARRAIYLQGRPIRGPAVEELLRELSEVPTLNAFSDCLGAEFNPSRMLTVDLLHEIELGVWKSLFTHLVRILYAASTNTEPLVVCLDERYRRITTFGEGTIRRFASNSSEMKKMAARDFEDLLQCSIPCFEGLLPEPHNQDILKLLYCLAEWHALAKLRMHTDGTLGLLDKLTAKFGKLIRHFRDQTCIVYSTNELPRETAARQRATNQRPGGSSNRERGMKLFSLSTIKLHFMGDYVAHIRRFGTTDSYSTQIGEQAHCAIKRLYGLTNKRDHMRQIGAKYSRQEYFRIREEQETRETRRLDHAEKHHVVALYNDKPINVISFVQENPLDPAKKGFLLKLKDHLLGRILGREFDADMHDDFTDADRNTIRIRNSTVYRHQTIRINYTTYDVRRDSDVLNTRNRRYCMVPAADSNSSTTSHSFWYAAVLGIFHADIQHIGPDSRSFGWQTMEFIWVRWLGFEPDYTSGRDVARLPKVGFVPSSDEYAFSFLDLSCIIRGCHLIPAFSGGRTRDLLEYEGSTEARPDDEKDDWVNFYVNIFIDRDMYMRYLGMGIGHQDPATSNQFHDASITDSGGNESTVAVEDEDEAETLSSDEIHLDESDVESRCDSDKDLGDFDDL